MIKLTEKAVAKVLEIMNGQDSKPTGLRIGVVGGGCSGFSYQLAFEKEATPIDKIFKYSKEGGEPKTDGELTVFVDQASMMYLDGTTIDYAETLEGAGFKFDNPNVKTTCGCGSSFST